MADSDTAMGEATEDNAADSNGTHAIPATLQDEQVHKALFQVTADGYIFSDMSKAPHWIGEVNDSEPLRKFLAMRCINITRLHGMV